MKIFSDFHSRARLIACVLCFWIATPIHGEDLLTEVQGRLTLAPVIRGEFLQTRKLVQIGKPLVSHGRFLIAQDVGIIWENISPLAQTTRLTRDDILQKQGQETLMRISADKEPMVRIVNGILFSVLSGDVAALSRLFDYSGKIEEDKTWRLRFVPKDRNMARLIRELRLQGARDISSVEMESAAGDVTRIEFKAQSYARTLSDAEKTQFE
jgi:hypothetical protein